ncbi:Uncharacterized SAM-binding protein YcdF, DUF218 family [Faunimonas pinastri]|uniref:Uncharacterized SAM-binding protein YcdF, DUF218 family n=1 Tax=Faunimonas pinastri TaxID=1855383 RepID=A0A1H9A2R7_9HYPH|nr:YdcF family protein [Faunimonas pinastri]SEP70793.1 Uncharacterized SAM-binding protein YcdF, DUF218 family [Faunimonas pinastri]
MFYVLSKLAWLLLDPGNFLVALLVLGLLIRLYRPLRRFGMGICVLATVCFVLLTIFPLGSWLLEPLENRVAAPVTMPERVDGIIVLGGATDNEVSLRRHQTDLNAAGERLTQTLVLARRYPEAKILLSGGTGDANGVGSDAAVMQQFMLEQGIDPARLIIENQSRNTRENAVFSQRIVQPRAGQTWLLVTSAFHMPRSLGCFRKVGWAVIPYPVDFRTPGDHSHHLVENLKTLSTAEKEWVGLAAYYTTGKIETLFPGNE